MAVKMTVNPKYDSDLRYRAICDQANKIEVDPNIPTKLYFHSGFTMVKMAAIYKDEGKYEPAMILYMKFIILFLEKLPRHPQYKSAPAADVKRITETLRGVFPIAEEIRAKVKQKYQVEEEEWCKQEKQRQEDIAHEMEKLRLEKEMIEAKVRDAAERKWLDEQEEKLKSLKEKEDEKRAAELAVAASGLTISGDSSISDAQHGTPSLNNLIAVPPPSNTPQIPDRSLKKNVISHDLPSLQDNRPFTDSPLAINTGQSTGLRTIEVPGEIMTRFLQLAESNTARNVETCGMLTGKMSNNVFKISHVLIPKQNGTSDTCDTQNEEEIFDYQDKHDLFTLGWIHTHPSQTAFLSSIDMHTHCSYQLMLPEAIAIVCAPKHGETGIFSLTPHGGMPTISKCREQGFHHHQQHPPLFDTSKHVKIMNHASVVIEDFRNK